jgi:peptidoglycan-associated lipoprotein
MVMKTGATMNEEGDYNIQPFAPRRAFGQRATSRHARLFPDAPGQAIIRSCSNLQTVITAMSLSCRSILLLAFIPLLLGACASAPSAREEKVTPPAVFKAHPGLLGQAAPPELQPIEAPKVEPVEDADKALNTQMSARKNANVADGEARSYSVYFDYRETRVKPDHIADLQAIGQRLAANPTLRARIEGHADERGDTRYNWHLGIRRAVAVKTILRAAGAKARQLRVISHGDTRPRRHGQDEDSWAENRRVDVLERR